MNNVKKGSSAIFEFLFGAVFVVVGIVLIFIGINRIVRMNAGKFVETQATITKIETETVSDENGFHEEYDITVEYQVDGKKFVSHLGETPRDFYEGMELKVLYDVDKPTDVVLPGKTSAILMIVFGAAAAICGGAVTLKRMFKQQ